jgi:4-amino-4-deoxy-L-arabinose transferase-like glycosyltransferase
MPDTPQLFFWLLAMYLFARSVAGDPANKGTRWLMILAGFAVGLAMLSKYTSVYLWIGSGLFIILYNRKWLRSVYLYISILLSLLVFLPVIVWNVQNDFISFTFHGGRAGFFQGGLQPQFFLTELTGEVLYNNPLVFLIIILALIAVIRGKSLFVTKGMERLILLWSLPLILTFLFLSLFRQTLPHWTGPAYTTLIFLAAAFLSGKQELGGRKRQLRWYPASALSLLLIIMVVGVLQVNYGFFYNGSEEEMTQRGKDDVSLDMYGWDQVMKEFRWLASEHESRGIMKENSPIVTHRWFPAAHLDYYVARHTNKVVLAYGSLKDIHKYGWINSIRGGFRDGMDAYYITTSRDYKDPEELFAGVFRKIELAYYFPIVRHGRNAAYGFVYHLKGFEGNKKDDIFFN